jgi:hypothetical protein
MENKAILLITIAALVGIGVGYIIKPNNQTDNILNLQTEIIKIEDSLESLTQEYTQLLDNYNEVSATLEAIETKHSDELRQTISLSEYNSLKDNLTQLQNEYNNLLNLYNECLFQGSKTESSYPDISPTAIVPQYESNYELDGDISDYSILSTKIEVPTTSYSFMFWLVQDSEYLYIPFQFPDEIHYGTAFFVSFDLNGDGIVDDSNDFYINWRGDSHGGPGGDGWIRVHYLGEVYDMRAGISSSTRVITAYRFESWNAEYGTSVTSGEIWVPLSYLSNDWYRGHFRFSPNTSTAFTWEDSTGTDIQSSYYPFDAEKYGLVVLK